MFGPYFNTSIWIFCCICIPQYWVDFPGKFAARNVLLYLLFSLIKFQGSLRKYCSILLWHTLVMWPTHSHTLCTLCADGYDFLPPLLSQSTAFKQFLFKGLSKLILHSWRVTPQSFSKDGQLMVALAALLLFQPALFLDSLFIMNRQRIKWWDAIRTDWSVGLPCSVKPDNGVL